MYILLCYDSLTSLSFYQDVPYLLPFIEQVEAELEERKEWNRK